ncbi:hypothetical protein LO771_08620 [Streptacidiphilus sp. ASG 303]|uniref:hypothetical protein n=1 Tax=Streptacidiphilus sp. ASG 303 TaxID=2896847 RepID=UPI001E62AA53|nr:hypothetical protein [Streptacidiphilus sp. ASG 303]MCD0482463.1 hypothetical protein [Streptacidiphilus sp. ASG 303]
MHWSGLVDAYRHHILEQGKEPLFLLLVGFIGSFLFIRFSVRMIRRGVRWWPGNVTPGGLHIHHVVFGLGFLLAGGFGVFTTGGARLGLFGLLFGIGCGLVLDEFALLLHLEDVYWSEQGRKSVDAVIIGILVTGLLLTGYVPLGVVPGESTRWGLVAGLSVNALLSVVTLVKGKVWTGLLGILVPGLSLVGAVRLARPASPWARWRYRTRPRRAARAERRERRLHRRADLARTRLFDLIAGAPDKVAPHHTATRRVAERMAARMTAHLDAHEARRLALLAARRSDRGPAGRVPAGRVPAGRDAPAPSRSAPLPPGRTADGRPPAPPAARRDLSAARRRTVAAGRTRTLRRGPRTPR